MKNYAARRVNYRLAVTRGGYGCLQEEAVKGLNETWRMMMVSSHSKWWKGALRNEQEKRLQPVQ